MWHKYTEDKYILDKLKGWKFSHETDNYEYFISVQTISRQQQMFISALNFSSPLECNVRLLSYVVCLYVERVYCEKRLKL